MQAIKTKYLPATNFKSSRIRASCEAGSITIPYNHKYPGAELHRFAAFELIKKLEWDITEVYTGELKDCYVHVPVFNGCKDTNLPEFLKKQA